MIGVLIVCVCYILVNLSFFSVLSYHEILSTQAVALVRVHVTSILMASIPYGAYISRVFILANFEFAKFDAARRRAHQKKKHNHVRVLKPCVRLTSFGR